MPPVACRGCGGLFEPLEGATHPYMLSSPGCWAAYGDVLARECADPALFVACHRLTVDAYAVQHPGSPTDRRAVQSVWLHFAALDAMFSYGASHDAARALLQWLAGREAFPALPDMPAMPLTVRDIDAGDHARSVERWAQSAHAALAPLLKSVTDGWR